MADVFSPTKRSQIMARVKSSDTSPERRLAAALRAAGVRFRRHVDGLPGKPDFVISRVKVAVFVHGCFWHGHTCKRGARQPKSNADYWRKKIKRNVQRDARVKRELRAMGYAVHTVWECRMKKDWRPTRLLTAIEKRSQAGKTSGSES